MFQPLEQLLSIDISLKRILSILETFIREQRQLNSSTGATLTVQSTGTKLLEQNNERLTAVIVNTANSDLTIYFSNSFSNSNPFCTLVANGGVLVFGKSTDIPYLGRVFGSIPSGSDSVVVSEISVQH